MFTGIVESLGEVISLSDGRLEVRAEPHFAPEGFDEGESVAVNGCCLTVLPGEGLRFDLSPETLARTSLGDLEPSARVNLERAMVAGGRLGGHVVQGHVDTTGTFEGSTPEGNSVVMRFRTPSGYGRYLIDKGSVAIEGVSLTVVRPEVEAFEVWVIPHTLEKTNLGSLKSGDRVNLEFDVLAKYVERLLEARLGA
ncbi:riboflavin synthase [bacterium]|nr:MAG: riboflavin synthase [bacterium]